MDSSTRQENLEKIRQILDDLYGIDPGTTTEEASFTRDLGLSDVDMDELLSIHFEWAFDIKISHLDHEKLTTVASVLDYVENRKA